MKFPRFPWIIYTRFFVFQSFAFNAVLLVLVLAYDWMFPRSVLEVSRWPFFFSFFLINIAVAAMTSYQFTVPFSRLLRKTLRLSNKKRFPSNGSQAQDDLFEEEVGEYLDFERALDRIGRKLKKRKEQLQRERDETQAFMSSVQEGLISVSPEEKVLYYNKPFAHFFLDSSQKESMNLSLTQIFRVPEIYENFRKVLSLNETQKVSLKLSTQVEKTPRYFLVYLTPLRKFNSKEIFGVLGVFYDITDLKKMEQIRIDFVGNASHELRTPLTSIKGYVETLKEDLAHGRLEPAAGFVDVISKNVNRLIDLVNDLLSLSTLESNSVLKTEVIHPLQLSEQVIGDLILLAQEKNQMIQLRSSVSEFVGDQRKVEQVLRNLVVNAIRYIPSGKNIQIVWEEEGGNVVLRVIDNGPGIPPEHHDRIFERFYRIDKGRSRDQGGTGLGLAIVKHIMHSHGGSVRVQSTPGNGAEFICQFPRRGPAHSQEMIGEL